MSANAPTHACHVVHVVGLHMNEVRRPGTTRASARRNLRVGWRMAPAVEDAKPKTQIPFPTSKEVGHPCNWDSQNRV